MSNVIQQSAHAGEIAAHAGHKPAPPAPWHYGTAEAYAAACRAYMYAYEAVISSLKVGML